MVSNLVMKRCSYHFKTLNFGVSYILVDQCFEKNV